MIFCLLLNLTTYLRISNKIPEAPEDEINYSDKYLL